LHYFSSFGYALNNINTEPEVIETSGQELNSGKQQKSMLGEVLIAEPQIAASQMIGFLKRAEHPRLSSAGTALN
jgi:hypothetical protein